MEVENAQNYQFSQLYLIQSITQKNNYETFIA